MSGSRTSRAHRALFTSLAAALVHVGLASCTSIARSIASGVAGQEIEQEFEFYRPAETSGYWVSTARWLDGPIVGISEGLLDRLQSDGTVATERSRKAASVLSDPVARELLQAHAFLLGAPRERLTSLEFEGPRENVAVARFDRTHLARFAHVLEEAALSDDWEALAARMDSQLSTLQPGDPLRVEAAQLDLTAKYIKAYTVAYFRGGAFFEAKLDIEGLRKKLEKELKERFPKISDADLAKLLDQLVEKLHPQAGSTNEIPIFGKIGDGGFVTRAGAKYQFPALEATIDPTGKDIVSLPKLDLTAIGSDLVRTFLEATFDSKYRLAAVDTATGAGLKEGALERYSALPNPSVSPEEFGWVNDYSNMVEGAVGSLVGRLIRGIGWFSLNNEALAGIVETGVSVIARKASEKLIWDYFEGHGSASEPLGAYWADKEPATLRIVIHGKPEL